MTATYKCEVAGDRSYFLSHSNLDAHNWYIKNTVTDQIVWNGAFDDVTEAITAAEVDVFEFARIPYGWGSVTA